jgi:hypothetical protein
MAAGASAVTNPLLLPHLLASEGWGNLLAAGIAAVASAATNTLLQPHLFASEGWGHHVWPAVGQVQVQVVEVLQELCHIAAQHRQQLGVALQDSTATHTSRQGAGC